MPTTNLRERFANTKDMDTCFRNQDQDQATVRE